MKKSPLISLILIALCAALSVAAQYRFDAWSIDDGLPQNSVRAITQTRDGYLWIATLDGLARFDGVRFTVFNKSTNKELITTRFSSMFQAADGALWLGTESNGVIRFYNNKFENYTVRDGLPGDQLTDIYAESDGRIAVSTLEGTAYWRDGKFLPETDRTANQQRLIYYNPQSRTRWTIDIPNRLTREKDAGRETFKLPFSTAYLSQSEVFEDRSGALWISQSYGLWRFFDGEFKFYYKEQGFFGAVNCFYEDREGTLWIGTAEKGVYRFRDGVFFELTVRDGLSSNAVNHIFQDREGTIWIGTDNRGLNRLQKQLISTFSTREGLSGVNAYPILADSRGRVWIGVQDGNLNVIENGAIRQFDAWGIRTMTEANDGTIWICGQDRIYLYRGERLEELGEDAPPQLTSNFVHAVQTDRAGAMWFSTTVGLFRLRDGEWTHFNKANGFPTDETRFVHEAANGDFYVGTYDGLILIPFSARQTPDADESRLKAGLKTFTVADGLSSNYLRSIHEDADGALWLGTYDGGLSRFKDGKFVNYTTGDGLFSDGVFAILPDDRGNFWMSSNQGIHRVSKQELNDFADGRIKKVNGVGYGKRDGMLNAECNGGRQPAGAKTSDGRLWFATQDGAAIVDPRLLVYNELPPPVVIETALADREKIDFRDEIRLAPGQRNLEIQFTALSFIRSAQMRFRYKIEGLNDDWIDAGTRRDAYFSYLPAGEYTFRVTAANADGVWNEQGAAIRLVVVPSFYQTRWFITLAALAVSLMIYAIFRTRLNRLQREKALAQDFSRRLIESQERERSRIAAELHDGLSQSLVIIKNRAALSLKKKENAEHAFEQLEEIAQASTEAIDEAKEIIYDLRPIQLDRLGLTKAIEAMLRRVSETHEITFVSDVAPLDGIFSKDAESSIYRILQEAVNNVVRHSEASKVVVKIKRSVENVQIFIRDDGKGFVIEPNNGTERGGFGLTGIRERARQLGGEASIESETGAGTTVKVILPLEKSEV